MDLYSVDPFSLQNHLSAPSREMTKVSFIYIYIFIFFIYIYIYGWMDR